MLDIAVLFGLLFIMSELIALTPYIEENSVIELLISLYEYINNK
jgi:hypothetical protein